MSVRIAGSKMFLCLLLTVGICIMLAAAPVGATPTLEWNGNQSVTGNQTVSGGVNVGSSTDAATAQVKMESSSGSPSVAWSSTYSPGNSGPNYCGAASGTNWTEQPSGDELAAALGSSSYYAQSPYGSMNLLSASSFGFSIPSNATVVGIEVLYKVKVSSGSETVTFQVAGCHKSITATSSWVAGTVGSPTDTWGASLIGSDVNASSFGVQTGKSTTAATYYQVDYLQIKVYYSSGAQWMAGTYYYDGSWRLAKHPTSLYTNTKLTIAANGYLRIGSSTTPSYPLHMAGGAYCTGTTWTNSSSRASKLNIAPVPVASAWDLLDQLQPVDFEYRRTETQFKLRDGTVVREKPADPNDVAEEVTVWTDEGSGEHHRGFIAEDTPAPLTRGDGIAAIDIAANNTAALKEAKRRILELERQMAGVTGSGTAGVGTAELGGAASGVTGLLSDLSNLSDPTDLSDEAVERLTESVLKKIGVEPWVEIPLADAIETVPETTETAVTRSVTKYRLNLETAQSEAYTVEETVKEQTQTGNMVKRLKSGVRYDEATGKAYRWCGIAGETPTQTTAALLKQLLPSMASVRALCSTNP